MEYTIQNITDNLIAKLPDNSESFRPSELLEAGIPSFVVERVKIELFRNLSESIVPPETDWADMNSERVERSWKSFIEAIRAEAQLPKGFVHSVLETAVADILEMLTKPRATLPDVLFGVDDALNFESMLERKKSVVVFTYLVDILPRYMEKKELDVLTKQQCRRIIEQVDEKVTANYTPLNWVQLLEPLFELCHGRVDSELLRLFFEDKENTELANCFDDEPGDVTQRQAIEILSGYHLKYGKEEERGNEDEIEESARDSFDKRSENRGLQSETTSNMGTADDYPKGNSPQPFDEKHSSDETEPNSANESNDSSVSSPSLNQREYKETETSNDHGHDSDFDSDSKAEEKPLHSMFSGSEPEIQKPKGEQSGDVNDSREPDDDNVEDEDEDDELPMWQKFARQQKQKAEHPKQEKGSSPIKHTESEEPSSASGNGGGKTNINRQLRQYLSEHEDYFTEHIFKGDNHAYREALTTLAGFESWSQASRHLQHEIFKRYLVDIFSEAAVDFTDQLQNFYTEYKTEG